MENYIVTYLLNGITKNYVLPISKESFELLTKAESFPTIENVLRKNFGYTLNDTVIVLSATKQ